MTIVNASNADEAVNITLLSNQFNFDGRDPGGNNFSPNQYSWLTTGGDDIQVNGSGINAAQDPPTQGLASSIDVDLSNDDFASPDVEISAITRPNAFGAPFSTARLSVITNSASDFFGEVLALADTMTGSAFNDTFKAGGGADTLTMGAGADTAYGGDGGDTLFGGSGADTLIGEAGDDDLFGGSGADILRGGAGADRLVGSTGADTFDFNATTDSTPGDRDVIDDFGNPGNGAGDVIDLSGIDANTGVNGNQTFAFLGAIQNPNPPSTAAGSMWLRNEGGDTIVYATVNAGDAPELAIRIDDGATVASDYSSLDFIA